MKQTAVEWLLENLNSEPYSEEEFNHNSNCWDKALEIEKEQIYKAVYYCLESVKISDDKTMFTATTAEQYYHETFKQ